MTHWSAAVTSYKQEEVALSSLCERDFSCYLPRYQSRGFVKGRLVEQVLPLFSGYIFFEVDEAWREVSHLDGVSHLILDDNEAPVPLRTRDVEKIKSREGPDGLILLDGFEYQDRSKRRRFRKGEKVEVKTGPLMGLVGLFEAASGSQEVKALFDILGKSTSITIHEADLCAA